MYSTQTFLERSQKLQERIRESTTQLAILEKDLEYEKEKDANINNFLPACKSLLAYYWELSIPERNKALKILLEGVEYKKTEKNKRGKKDTPTFELTLKPRIPRI